MTLFIFYLKILAKREIHLERWDSLHQEDVAAVADVEVPQEVVVGAAAEEAVVAVEVALER